MDSRGLGQYGEEQAVKYLKKKRAKIVDRNFKCRGGEIDIIYESGGYIVFAEVKLRKNAEHGAAMEFVTPAKQRRIILTAQVWLSLHPTELQPRFDVIEIYAPDGEKTRRPEINHIEDAFQ